MQSDTFAQSSPVLPATLSPTPLMAAIEFVNATPGLSAIEAIFLPASAITLGAEVTACATSVSFRATSARTLSALLFVAGSAGAAGLAKTALMVMVFALLGPLLALTWRTRRFRVV